MTNLRTYAGIGSRRTPERVLRRFELLGAWLGERGWLLRSGAAVGADSAFELGCDAVGGPKEIYLPHERFNGSTSPLTEPSIRAYMLAEEHHPNWRAVGRFGRAAHARNGHQVLGGNLDCPANMILCWTEKGLGGGGTGQALRLARKYGVPVFDFGAGWEPTFERWKAWMRDAGTMEIGQASTGIVGAGDW